jgi:hypothetical protein
VITPPASREGVSPNPYADSQCQRAADTGCPFTTWSLSKLVRHLRDRHRIVAGVETVRQVIRAAGVRWQATKTWKASRDPQFSEKMHRILDLYDRSAAGLLPDRGRVICVDEFGPLNLQPRPGRGWFPSRNPSRLRATYNRYGGVRHMLAGLDLASGQLFYRLRDRKLWQGFLDFLCQLRTRFPTGWLYVVWDSFSHTSRPGSRTGAPTTMLSWCSLRPTPRG